MESVTYKASSIIPELFLQPMLIFLFCQEQPVAMLRLPYMVPGIKVGYSFGRQAPYLLCFFSIPYIHFFSFGFLSRLAVHCLLLVGSAELYGVLGIETSFLLTLLFHPSSHFPFYFGATTSSAQGLLLPLCSRITPDWLGDHIGYWGSNLGWLCRNQTPSPSILITSVPPLIF